MTLSSCCSAPVTFVESTPKYTNYKCSRCGQNPCDLQPPAESGSGIVEAPTAQNIHRLLDENSEELCESFREYHTLAKQYIRSLESKLSVSVDKINKAKAFFTRQAETMHDCGMGTKDVYDFLDTL